MKFSIITVCLNPGEKLGITLGSVLAQTCTDMEIILKDGCSRDGSVEKWRREHGGEPGADRVRIFTEKDSGIYDAMNQAVSHARGEFLLFLNCGDVFPDEGVLERTLQVIEEERRAGAHMDRLVLYGDTCSGKNHVTIASPPEITGFTCYRNIPCHQSCFYSAGLCREKPYDLQYKIRADYDHFLWCFYKAGAKMRHMDFPVASYEGGGYSESRENRERDKKEHRQITASYMSRAELFKYRAILACTLAPLRSRMAESRAFSGMYHWVKERVYRRKYWIVAAFFLFVIEVALLVWPVGWLREDKVSYLTGENSRVLQASKDNAGYCQEFAPLFDKIKSIGIVMVEGDSTIPEEGSMSVTVSDAEGTILFHTDIPYKYIRVGSYTDVQMNLSLKHGRHYYLSVNFQANEEGKIPSLAVCGEELFDLETYKKVEELFENRQSGEKMFIFDLKIQNHGGYAEPDVNWKIQAENVSSAEADAYLSLIRESDEALKELITYFERQEEPVIICMFGDHQPKIAEDAFYQGIYNQTVGMEERDKTLNMYKTPFIIWANYDIPERENLDISMNYLGVLLLDVAGIPGSPHFSFLRQYMENYPIITINGYQDGEGNFYNWTGDNSELSEYRMIQYNYLFDKNIVEKGFSGT